MSAARTVSPILHDIDNLVGFLKRGRLLDSDDQSVSSLIEKAKRRKMEKTNHLEISKEARLISADHEGKSSRPPRVRSGLCLSLKDKQIDCIRYEKTRDLLLNHKKLHLVLDLDHTLLNTLNSLDKLSPDEQYLKTQTHSLQHVYIVDTPAMQLVTKLRPFIRTFLVQASRMFELSIYTMGSRDYAFEMMKLLDPGNQIFDGRVISRCDRPEADKKGLDALLARDSAVLILDDTKDVWINKNQGNVIEMQRYHFFKSSCQQYGFSNVKSYCELKTDECDPRGAAYLANVLQLLRHIHTVFFNEVELQGEGLINRDVRHVMKVIRKEVLKGCKIVFSHVIPSNLKPDIHPLWKMAEQLGATCSTEVDSSVTHVVAADATTEKSLWAVKQDKFLVNPDWIHSANFMWQKQPEGYFPCQYSIPLRPTSLKLQGKFGV